MMLKYGHIQQLNHVSFRPRIAKALQMDSDDCYKELMGNLADGEELAKHEFILRDPHPPGPYSRKHRKKGQQRMRREEAYLKERRREQTSSFAWNGLTATSTWAAVATFKLSLLVSTLYRRRRLWFSEDVVFEDARLET